jgi:hypothetical protein
MWDDFAVGGEVLRRRDILAPRCQGLYCSGVVRVIIKGDVCSERCVCAYFLGFVSVGCVCWVGLSGGCQLAVRSRCKLSVNDLGVMCTGIAVGTTLLRECSLGSV